MLRTKTPPSVAQWALVALLALGNMHTSHSKGTFQAQAAHHEEAEECALPRFPVAVLAKLWPKQRSGQRREAEASNHSDHHPRFALVDTIKPLFDLLRVHLFMCCGPESPS